MSVARRLGGSSEDGFLSAAEFGSFPFPPFSVWRSSEWPKDPALSEAAGVSGGRRRSAAAFLLSRL